MNKLRYILLISDTLFYVSGALLAPIYALYVEKIGGDLLDASITSSLFMLTAGIVIYLFAKWEDRAKHQRKFVILGYGISVLGYLGYLFVNSSMALFVVQIVLGLGVALKDPAYDGLFSEADTHSALAWGEWEALSHIVYGAGAIVGGFVASIYGFRPLLWFMFLFSIFAFLVSLFLIKMKGKNV